MKQHGQEYLHLELTVIPIRKDVLVRMGRQASCKRNKQHLLLTKVHGDTASISFSEML